MWGLWKMLPGELLLAGGRVPRTLKREPREGPSLGIGVLQEREAHLSPTPSNGERSPGERPDPQT